MFYEMVRGVIAPVGKAIYRPNVEGSDNVPRKGAVILAGNHLSFIDSVVIPLVAPRPVSFLAKSQYFEKGSLRKRFVGTLMGALGQVPVQRGQGRASMAALDSATEILRAGGAFGIYPEGTRSLDGRLHRGHTGVAQLALTTGAPVVPVAMIGTEKMLPHGARIPRRTRITIRFGKPLDFSRYDGLADSPPIRRSVTDEIMYAILELSGQEYVDAYHKRPDAA